MGSLDETSPRDGRRTARTHWSRGVLFRTAMLAWGLVTLTAALFLAVNVTTLRRALTGEMASNSRTIAATLTQVTDRAILADDYALIVDHFSEVIREHPVIIYLVVSRSDGFSVAVTRKTWQKLELPGYWSAPSPELRRGSIVPNSLGEGDVYHVAIPVTTPRGWGYLHVGLSTDAMNADLAATYRQTVLLFAMCCVLGLGLSVLFARRITKPLRRLHETTARLGAGDLAARSDIRSGDEVESLAQAFNQMAESLCQSSEKLQSAHDLLEERVAERTQQLSRSTEQLQAEVAERERTEERLRLSEERYRRMLDSIPDAVFVMDRDARLIYVNPTTARLIGRDAEACLSMGLGDVLAPASEEAGRRILAHVADGSNLPPMELEMQTASSRRLCVEAHFSCIRDAEGALTAIQAVGRDITHERVLERQLLHAEKMKAVGTLAGGIAHDFNNLLTAILGNVELARLEVPGHHAVLKRLDMVGRAGERATQLVRQLLRFSLPSETQTQVISLNDMVMETSRFLRAVIPSTIKLEYELQEPSCHVCIDPSAITQILTNLSVNARDAMPEGGTLRFSTAQVVADPALSRAHPELKPGAQCRLTVTDTGHGMSQEVCQHLFEPFFTTKERGTGTGLGLAMVYGAVCQATGCITVESRPGLGSQFDIYLPAATEVPAAAPATVAGTCKGSETVLLADDEDMILEIERCTLEGVGYRVLVAHDAREAVRMFTAHREEIGLVVLDMTMPQGGGARALEEIRIVAPSVPILICSGHAESDAVRNASRKASAFLPKPFAPSDLVILARRMLDGATQESAALARQ